MNQSEITFAIRKANKNDTDLLSALAVTTFYEAYFEQDEPPDLAEYIAKNFNLSVIESELQNTDSTFFIVYVGGKAVGYAKLRENSSVECIKYERTIELQRIYILQKMLGKGLGEKLLRHCCNEAAHKGYKSIWLTVWENNLPAQKFYLKQGFIRAGEIQFLYSSKIETNLVMRKSLQ